MLGGPDLVSFGLEIRRAVAAIEDARARARVCVCLGRHGDEGKYGRAVIATSGYKAGHASATPTLPAVFCFSS